MNRARRSEHCRVFVNWVPGPALHADQDRKALDCWTLKMVDLVHSRPWHYFGHSVCQHWLHLLAHWSMIFVWMPLDLMHFYPCNTPGPDQIAVAQISLNINKLKISIPFSKFKNKHTISLGISTRSFGGFVIT